MIEIVVAWTFLLTIQWDQNGTKYSKGKGLRVFAEGRVTAPFSK